MEETKKGIEDITETEVKEILEFASKMAADNCAKKGCDPSPKTL